MGILALRADERVSGVKFPRPRGPASSTPLTIARPAETKQAAISLSVWFTKDTLSVALRDGRTITVPLAWYPRLFNATAAQRKNWQVAGGGYGIHWPEIDEDLKPRLCAAAAIR